MRNGNVSWGIRRAPSGTSTARRTERDPGRTPCGRRFSLALTLLTLALIAAPSHAVVVELLTDNDLLGGNTMPDDQYSAGLGIHFVIGGNRITLEESLFTDRFVSGQRFDETWLNVDLSTPPVLGWDTYVNVGLVHVGDGILGESAQNEVHRWLGDELLDLEYPEDDEIHPTGRVRFARADPITRWGRLTPTFDVSAAVGHKYYARASVQGTWRLTSRISTRADVGLRYSRSDFEILDPFTREWGPAASLGFTFLESFEIAWSLNHYGTGQRHFRMGFRIPLESIGRSGR